MKRFSIFFKTLFLGLIFSFNHLNSQVALAFNGVNNYVSTNGSPVLNNLPRTVDAWIKTTSTITTQMVICDWGSTTPNGCRFTLNVINNKLRIEVGGVGFTGTTNVNTGQWCHVTAVYSPSITSGANAFLYLNGALEAAATFTGYTVLTTTTTVGFRIGVRSDGINFFNGSIDEVKVYNYPRTQTQIAADTIEYCGPQSGLVAYYKLNEGIPTANNTGSITATDYSGNANHGTLNSFTLTGAASNWVPGRITNAAPSIVSNIGNNICTGTSFSLSTNALTNYTWSTGNSSATLISVSPTVTTTYSVSAMNVIGCLVSSALTVSVNNAAPTLTILSLQNPICLGASASFTATGASSYTWSGGILNGQLFTPSSTATYTVFAANACGTASAVQSITVAPLPVNVSANSSVVCSGYTCNLTAGAAASTYTWMPGAQTGSSIIVAPFAASIYTVTAGNGTCIGTQTIQISTLASPTITASSSLVTICEGQSVGISAGGAGTNGTYTWSQGAGNTASVTVSPSVTTLYSVIGTNSLGCTSTAQLPVLVLAKPSFSITSAGTLICSGETVTLYASGANSYTWNTGANTFSLAQMPTSPYQVYTATATGISNSCTATETIAVAVIIPSVTFASSLNVCIGAVATLTANGASSYTWNGIPLGSNATQTVSPLSNSVYTLIAKTSSLNTNCFSTHYTSVQVNPLPSLTVIASPTVICKGNASTLTVIGASTYTWSGLSSNLSQVQITPTTSTTYSVLGQNGFGCIGQAQVLIKVNICGALNEQQNHILLNVYPNPANDIIQIETELEMQIELYSLDGSLLKTFFVNQQLHEIDVADQKSGVYFLRAHNESINLLKKIIIQ